MTTGGAPDVTSDGRIVPDKQGDVRAQHRPSAKSARVQTIKNNLHYRHHTHTAQINTQAGILYIGHRNCDTTPQCLLQVIIVKHEPVISDFLFCFRNVLSVQET